MTTQLPLQQALLDGGLERVSWWNGRVLTAEDLADLQRATDDADLRLGRAIRAGVVDGLLVSTGSDGRSVDVTAGLAVDRAGEVLALPDPVSVPLVTPPANGSADPAGFVTCPDLPTTFKATGHGAYLLTIGSAAATRGAAQGADVRGIATRDCGPRYLVASVQFRLVAIDVEELAADAGHDDGDAEPLASVTGAGDLHPRARNVVAALLLDAVARRRAVIDPFGAGASRPPLLDQLHADGDLMDCEVPIAVVVWKGGNVGFNDTWAVRRPPRHPVERWPSRVVGPGGVVAGLAALLQFTSELDELVGPGRTAQERGALRLRQIARYVPAAVLLPRVASGHPRGVSLVAFLDGIERRGGGLIAGGRLWPLVQASLVSPPIDLDGGEPLRTYAVREAEGVPGVQPAALLAADHLSHLALAPEQDGDHPEPPDVAPAGELVLAEDMAHLLREEIVAGESYDLQWRLTAATAEATSFLVEAQVVEAVGADVGAWASAIEVLTADGKPLEELLLEPEVPGQGSGEVVVVRVSVPPRAERATFSLVVSCPAAPDDPGLNRASSPVELVIGEPVQPSDERIVFERPKVDPQLAQVRRDGVLEIARGRAIEVEIGAILAEGGRFGSSWDIEPDPTGWTIEVVGSRQPLSRPNGGRATTSVRLVAGPDASPGTLVLAVDQVGDERPSYRSVTRIPLLPSGA